MTTLPLQFVIYPEFSAGFNYDLHAYARLPDGRVAIQEQCITFRSLTQEEASQVPRAPLLHLSKESLQSLIDQLWQLGIRPTEGHGSTGQLAATERHLEHTTRLLDSTLLTVQYVVNASLITTAKLAVNPVNPVTS